MPTHMFDEDKEKKLVSLLYEGEYSSAKRAREAQDAEFDSYIDLLDSVREPKQYEWMSDIRLPEFISHVLTQASIDADQYFRTRDFVEVYLQDESDEAVASSNAAKECINRTLNQRHIYHFSKYMRGKMLNTLVGRVYARCWWEKQTKEEVIGTKIGYKPLEIDVMGRPYEEGQERAYEVVEENETKTVPVIDRFNYDIIDSKNVVTSNEYVYSLQDKAFVYVRHESSLTKLRAEAELKAYFNLELLDAKLDVNTETAKETYNKGDRTVANEPVALDAMFDVVERYGKFWVVDVEEDAEGNPVTAHVGIDREGKPVEGAKYIEVIMAWAVKDHSRTLIRFQPNPFRDTNGAPYRPLIRGICYIHPVDDGGMGDGKNARELQLALDDTVNISNDRVLLATLPTLIVKKFTAEDNPDIYIEPGHKIPLDNPKEDINWLEVRSDISGALNQIQLFRQMMQQVDSTFPTTMGDVPTLASTTATAVAGADEKAGKRTNLKSLTFENTFLGDLYWMVLQMTWQFAHPDTGMKLMGKKVYDFNPSLEYFYKPVSQSIETEYSKITKVKLWTQIISYLTSVQHPDTVKFINYALAKIAEYMGDEFVNVSDKLLNPNIPIQAQGGSPEGMAGGMMPVSNQNGTPQSVMEQATRMGM